MPENRRVGCFRLRRSTEWLAPEVEDALWRDIEVLDSRYDRITGKDHYRATHPSFEEIENTLFPPWYRFVIATTDGIPEVTWHRVPKSDETVFPQLLEVPRMPPGTELAASAHGDGFTCPKCRRTSFHPRDAEERYCSTCGFADDLNLEAICAKDNFLRAILEE